MIRIGLDEAGYGPLLGPLVIGASAFRVPDGEGPTIRERLKGLVSRATGRKPTGSVAAAIDDSKEVHGRWGVEGLARGVSAAVVGSGRAAPTDLADWLVRFGDRLPTAFAADPWFVKPEHEPVPAWEPPPGLRERFLLRGVEPLGVWVSPVTAAELNEAFDATDNKARVLFLATTALLVRVLDSFPGEDVDVVLDREGGRLNYTAYLADIFPFHEIRKEPSPQGTSTYAIHEGGRTLRLSFTTKGDCVDLPAGLASMAAKLTRELFMRRLNAWFVERLPGVKPTAGYVEDGRRFLGDVAPVIDAERLDRRRLIRSR